MIFLPFQVRLFLQANLNIAYLSLVLAQSFDNYYVSDYAVKCPPDREIDPCKCNNLTSEIECFGTKINDCALKTVFEQLMSYYGNTQEKHIKTLKIYKSEITFLNKELFGEMALDALDLNGNQNLSLTRIHRVTLAKSKETLREFKYFGLSVGLTASWINKEPNDGSIFEIVDGFMELNTFWIVDSMIPKIQRSAFGRCELPRLTSVRLLRDSIEFVGDYAFYRLPNLTHLDLRENLIAGLSNHTLAFEKSSEIHLYIDLSSNMIQMKNIDKGAFERLNRPVVLNLDYNLIEYLDEETFEPLLRNPKSSVHVSKNSITCDCRMEWLKRKDHDYMSRVHGLMCTQTTELWYFTENDLENECNETFKELIAKADVSMIMFPNKLAIYLLLLPSLYASLFTFCCSIII